MTATKMAAPPRTMTQLVPQAWMELLSNFAATWGKADGPAFGLHCSRCGQDLVAKNSLTDQVLRVSCVCQEYASDQFTL